MPFASHQRASDGVPIKTPCDPENAALAEYADTGEAKFPDEQNLPELPK
jgi:hypothetical protein